MKRYFLLFYLLYSIVILNGYSQVTIHLSSLPSSTPDGADIYFAGSLNQWNPADENFKFKIDDNGAYWLSLVKGTGQVEFKFTRGSWQTVEGDSIGGRRPNRSFTYGESDTLELAIHTWEDLDGGSTAVSTANEQVMVLDSAMYMPQLDRYRRIWVYLPQDYNTSDKSYKVLYMHDAQNVFDASTSFSGEWGVDETLTELENEGYETAIVIAIDNGGQNRLNEYSAFNNPQYGGGEGDAYLDFIINTLKPKVDAEFRTLKGPEHTGIMGSSMGGLISHYAYFRNPDVFGRVGIFSPSYWFSQQYKPYSLGKGKIGEPRLYMLAGELEFGLVNDARDMHNALVGAGFNSQELTLLTPPDGEHSEWFWAREFRDAFQWLFNTELVTSINSNVSQYIQVYPNPVNDTLSVVSKEAVNLIITDMQGKTIYEGVVDGKEKVDISVSKAGPLILQVEQNGVRELYKLIKQ